MSGPEFFQTVMGHRFYERDVPKIADTLGDIAKALPRLMQLLEARTILEAQTLQQSTEHSDDDARRDGDALTAIADLLQRSGPVESLNRVSLKVTISKIASILAKTGRV